MDLSNRIKGVYLDNAATSYPKPKEVLTHIENDIIKNGGNPSRSTHSLSQNSSDTIYLVRDTISRFVNYPYPEQVVFTQNATYALHIAIRGLCKPKKNHIIISDIDHNASYRLIHHLTDEGYEYTIVHSGENIKENLYSALKKTTGLVVINTACNICGIENDLSALSEFRMETGIPIIADVSQWIGHKTIDLTKTPIDVICAPGHKGLFGIMGCGFCVFQKGLELNPVIFGGSGSDSKAKEMPKDLPEKMEAGTLPVPAISSLFYGINYVNNCNILRIEKKLKSYCDEIENTIRKLGNVKVVGTTGHGVMSIVHTSIKPEKLAELLTKNGIMTRAGFHCSPLSHTRIGTEKYGTVRLSFSSLNTQNEIENSCKVLSKIDK